MVEVICPQRPTAPQKHETVTVTEPLLVPTTATYERRYSIVVLGPCTARKTVEYIWHKVEDGSSEASLCFAHNHTHVLLNDNLHLPYGVVTWHLG